MVSCSGPAIAEKSTTSLSAEPTNENWQTCDATVDSSDVPFTVTSRLAPLDGVAIATTSVASPPANPAIVILSSKLKQLLAGDVVTDSIDENATLAAAPN